MICLNKKGWFPQFTKTIGRIAKIRDSKDAGFCKGLLGDFQGFGEFC